MKYLLVAEEENHRGDISDTQGKHVLILPTDGNANYLLQYNVAW
jgi:hypothetical protein